MDGKKVTITVDALGRPKVEAHNYTGDSCVEATRKIEEGLASGEGFRREFKEEWHNSEEETETNTQEY